ncbi:methylated-DNA-[protein]-cysteine S-methyltransferase [Kitasatospora sp. MAA4]|uniref:methylated-DNA--[protein]-cysteine S-methyltransferase n=1 Tax=Kitasatospora sp. MAA4 TaxID=3035093 RepID=UPI00247328DA|nr:methylated-DNA--[protein]-cysteine S-methyltransferase [Kitasatospora sp. MAA4]MDH6137873.1 methylated-DNA-[protein]-cysteine S-methyltransferase [Kitasatospora sp. MAA4]
MIDTFRFAHETRIGTMELIATDQHLVYCAFAPARVEALARAGLAEPSTVASQAVLDRAVHQIDGYLAGELREFALPLDLRLATAFGRQVLAALAGVGYGRTATYGELARAIGRPTAARAVGARLGANPLCVVLPCHRVVGSTGSLTGYAGGTDAKRQLLALEGIAV